MPPPVNLSDLSRAEPQARFVEFPGEVSELKQIVMAQRDENHRTEWPGHSPPPIETLSRPPAKSLFDASQLKGRYPLPSDGPMELSHS